MIPQNRVRRRRRRSEGQALVEFTLLLAPLLLLLGGIVEFGNAYNFQLSTANASRDGARYAALHPDAWSGTDPAAVSTIPWAVQIEGVNATVPNAWPGFVNTLTQKPANPPSGAGIAITYYYICAACLPTSGACGYYVPGSGFQLDAQWAAASAANTQVVCLQPGNLVKVGIRYAFTPVTPLLQSIAVGGFSVANATTMTIE